MMNNAKQFPLRLSDQEVFRHLLASGPLRGAEVLRVIAMRQRVRSLIGVEMVGAMCIERCHRIGGKIFFDRTKGVNV